MQMTPAHDNFLYRFNRDPFDRLLADLSLLYKYQYPPSMPVAQILDRVAADMMGSSFQYRFAPSARGLLPHERRPLQLLCFVNSGRETKRGIRLRRQPCHSLTLGDMPGNHTLYAPLSNDRSVEGNCFVVYLSKVLLSSESSHDLTLAWHYSCYTKSLHGQMLFFR